MKLLAFSAFSAAALAVPSLAQETQQTPENAHRFLSQLSNENRIQFAPPDAVVKFQSYSSHGNNGTYTISSDVFYSDEQKWLFKIAQSASCRTKITPAYIAPSETEYAQEPSTSDRGKITVPGTKIWHQYVAHLRYFNDNGIDWSRISRVNKDGSILELHGGAFSGGYLSLFFESPEMATRAAYAIEVIRQSCDPVASTGF